MASTLLLVDDHPLFRRGVKELVTKQCAIYDRVVEADNGREALDLIGRLAPECVMLDIAMPEIDGLHTLEIVRQQFPQTLCIMFSMYDNPEFVVRARSRGAHGYILKTDPDHIILECLQRVADGDQYVSATLGQQLDMQLPEVQINRDDLQRLSKREREILTLIARNLTSKEAAQKLCVSLRTIQNHRANICKKLRITGSNALLKIAIENQAWL